MVRTRNGLPLLLLTFFLGCANADPLETDAGTSGADAAASDSGRDATVVDAARDMSTADLGTMDATVVVDAGLFDASFVDASAGDAGPGDAGSVDASVVDEGMETDAFVADSGATMTVPVYYVSDTDIGIRLFREFRRVPASADRVHAAVDAMLHLAPLDPDYASIWSTATAIRSIAIGDATAIVDLSTEATTASAGAAAEDLSLQQLVYTVTAADPTITQVLLHIEGAPVESLWGHVDTSGPMTRGPRLELLAPVWIIDPQEGDSLTTLRMSGDATVFEAVVSYRVERSCLIPGCSDAPFTINGTVLATEGGPGRGTWEVDVLLPPEAFDGDGVVHIMAWEASAKDGSATHIDDKVITVHGP